MRRLARTLPRLAPRAIAPAATLAKKAKAKPDASESDDGLNLALNQIRKQHGQAVVVQLGSDDAADLTIPVISTGSLSLDVALGSGGLPRGRICEIFGPETSGKTTLALHVIAEAQKTGGKAVFVDAEHALDVAYAQRLGVNTDDLYICQPDDGEQALEIVDILTQSGGVDVIVVDSVAALVPRAELDGEMGDAHIGLQARMMSQAMRKLTVHINRSKTLVLFINQTRQKVAIGWGSGGETTSGGTALKFYATQRLNIRRTGILQKDGEAYGTQVKVKVVKNKLAAPLRIAEFDIDFDHGISKAGELIDVGIKAGVVQKSGAWLYWGEDREMLAQGREKAKILLRENAEIAAKIEEHVRAYFRNGNGDASDVNDEGIEPVVASADHDDGKPVVAESVDGDDSGTEIEPVVASADHDDGKPVVVDEGASVIEIEPVESAGEKDSSD